MGRTNWYTLHARGHKAFNDWRALHPRARPNFSGINFHKQTSFSQYDLRGADLSNGHFPRASFSGADLRGADLSGAYLGYAVFDRSDLREANLRDADLRDAFLRRTNLEGADLSGADLRQASLTDAIVGQTDFTNVDLCSARGVGRVKHTMDSTIDISTIYRSNGRISDAFLRGAGVPKKTISHIRELSARTSTKRAVFLSHSSKDKEVAEILLNDLQVGNVRCFYAPYDLHPGEAFPDRISAEIRAATAFLVLVSRNSLESKWVAREYEAAMKVRAAENPNLKIVPVRLDSAILKRKRLAAWSRALKKSLHVINLSPQRRGRGYWQAFDELVDALDARE